MEIYWKPWEVDATAVHAIVDYDRSFETEQEQFERRKATLRAQGDDEGVLTLIANTVRQRCAA